MGRPQRVTAGGLVYHVFNRAMKGTILFGKSDDYAALERVLAEGSQQTPIRLLCYCLMPNHWHLVLWPFSDGDLSAFVQRVTLTHTQRWRAHHGNVGAGHLYQGRFKSFPVEQDEHFLTLCRYVERNPLRAGLVRRAERWRWSSLWRRIHQHGHAKPVLTEWPVQGPRDWVMWVDQPLTVNELTALRGCAQRGRPFGSEAWMQRVSGTPTEGS